MRWQHPAGSAGLPPSQSSASRPRSCGGRAPAAAARRVWRSAQSGGGGGGGGRQLREGFSGLVRHPLAAPTNLSKRSSSAALMEEGSTDIGSRAPGCGGTVSLTEAANCATPRNCIENGRKAAVQAGQRRVHGGAAERRAGTTAGADRPLRLCHPKYRSLWTANGLGRAAAGAPASAPGALLARGACPAPPTSSDRLCQSFSSAPARQARYDGAGPSQRSGPCVCGPRGGRGL